jgi:hypothetical protein
VSPVEYEKSLVRPRALASTPPRPRAPCLPATSSIAASKRPEAQHCIAARDGFGVRREWALGLLAHGDANAEDALLVARGEVEVG